MHTPGHNRQTLHHHLLQNEGDICPAEFKVGHMGPPPILDHKPAQMRSVKGFSIHPLQMMAPQRVPRLVVSWAGTLSWTPALKRARTCTHVRKFGYTHTHPHIEVLQSQNGCNHRMITQMQHQQSARSKAQHTNTTPSAVRAATCKAL